MGQFDLDDLRELKDDFATELRRRNRSKITIDGYLIEHELPTLAPEVTRDHIGSFIESLLTRPNKCSGRRQFADGQSVGRTGTPARS